VGTYEYFINCPHCAEENQVGYQTVTIDCKHCGREIEKDRIDEYADCASWAESTCFNCGEWFQPTDEGLRLFEIYDLSHHLHYGVGHRKFKKMLREVRRRVRAAFSRGGHDYRLKKPVCEKCLSTGYLAEVVSSGESMIRNGGLDFEGTDKERAYWEDMKWS